ncbi:DUF4395 family protein [bacterium]|nr:DUF4395 family protein [bacterium]
MRPGPWRRDRIGRSGARSIMTNTPATPSKRNFVLQQGFDDPAAEVCATRYDALQFQPRAVGVVVAVGIVLQSATVFLLLAAVLAWSAARPRRNPFDAVYNVVRGARDDRRRLPPAPPPRRFAQSLAALVAALIALSLLASWREATIALQGFLAAAVLALAAGRFCFGSFVFHLLRGRGEFARRTLPWSGRG